MKEAYRYIVVIAMMMLIACCTTPSNDKKQKYVYYDVPTYTTTYAICYPDTTIVYTHKQHRQSELSSSRGTNYLSSRNYRWNDEPPYWQESWDKEELYVTTTAPIRVISETVEYKKVRYVIR